jgi:hypothetical protein
MTIAAFVALAACLVALLYLWVRLRAAERAWEEAGAYAYRLLDEPNFYLRETEVARETGVSQLGDFGFLGPKQSIDPEPEKGGRT